MCILAARRRAGFRCLSIYSVAKRELGRTFYSSKWQKLLLHCGGPGPEPEPGVLFLAAVSLFFLWVICGETRPAGAELLDIGSNRI